MVIEPGTASPLDKRDKQNIGSKSIKKYKRAQKLPCQLYFGVAHVWQARNMLPAQFLSQAYIVAYRNF